MDETTFTMDSADGEVVFVYQWSGNDPPHAIVQIAHGMGEHAARYRRVAEALVDAGYVVVANDHRGHGRTAGEHGDPHRRDQVDRYRDPADGDESVERGARSAKQCRVFVPRSAFRAPRSKQPDAEDG